ncbi:unnamed protein product [Dovyalis caffra]|uniref:Uncharacterized protein n=1 Tax=Dovyalis caffra TaxID=77055 RepID=A0AAV1S964_9ROSI|nr:unnamed protein product [Dovyalis caffra]
MRLVLCDPDAIVIPQALKGRTEVLKHGKCTVLRASSRKVSSFVSMWNNNREQARRTGILLCHFKQSNQICSEDRCENEGTSGDEKNLGDKIGGIGKKYLGNKIENLQ